MKNRRAEAVFGILRWWDRKFEMEAAIRAIPGGGHHAQSRVSLWRRGAPSLTWGRAPLSDRAYSCLRQARGSCGRKRDRAASFTLWGAGFRVSQNTERRLQQIQIMLHPICTGYLHRWAADESARFDEMGAYRLGTTQSTKQPLHRSGPAEPPCGEFSVGQLHQTGYLWHINRH
jgi:hypothetical protein